MEVITPETLKSAPARKIFIGCKFKGDFSGADLRGAYLNGAYLSEAYLRGANLSGAYLRGANLSGADLSGADLSGANLSEANLNEANLREAYLRGANLSGADLSGADLSGANLREAYLRGANLSRADLREANLSEANLSEANLSEANLSEANLNGACLNEANLNEANLNEANLGGANLRGANLAETQLGEFIEKHEKLHQEFLKQKVGDLKSGYMWILCHDDEHEKLHKEAHEFFKEKLASLKKLKEEEVKKMSTDSIGKEIIKRASIHEVTVLAQATVLEVLALFGVRKSSKLYKFFKSDISTIPVKIGLALFLKFCPFTQTDNYKYMVKELFTQAGVSSIRETIEILLSLIAPQAKKLVGMIEALTTENVRVSETSNLTPTRVKKLEEVEQVEEFQDEVLSAARA